MPKLSIGDEVRVACDNCAADLTAKIYFIATYAEYTPPVIYSLEERNKLVYLIQARPSRPDALRVGQPIDVYLNPKTPGGGQAMNAGNDIAIDVKGLTKSFGGREVVHDLSMQVKRGSIYGFLGPNGSGKTTTIRILCGLLTPDSGEGTCLGYDILKDADKIKRQVGYMTQRFSLYQDLSVRENLEFVARLYGMRDARGAARDMIKRLGLVRARGAARRRALRRLEAAPCARCLHAAQSKAVAAGRADGRRRSRRRGAISGTRSMRSQPKGSPCWSRPITWTRPSAATRSPTSPTAIC